MTDPDRQSGQRSILFVHGRDFKPAKDVLAELCFGAVRAGIERDFPDHVARFDDTRSECAYYGDLTNELLGSRGHRFDESLDIGDRRNALAALRDSICSLYMAPKLSTTYTEPTSDFMSKARASSISDCGTVEAAIRFKVVSYPLS